jgi:flagellar motility protein MotE (MotC chaperone)
MTLIDLGAIFVAIIAAGGAWLSARSAAKASKTNLMVSGRLAAEQEAYERARNFDVDTIKRQATQIDELRRENETLRRDIRELQDRLSKIEHISPKIERLLDEDEGQGSNH